MIRISSEARPGPTGSMRIAGSAPLSPMSGTRSVMAHHAHMHRSTHLSEPANSYTQIIQPKEGSIWVAMVLRIVSGLILTRPVLNHKRYPLPIQEEPEG